MCVRKYAIFLSSSHTYVGHVCVLVLSSNFRSSAEWLGFSVTTVLRGGWKGCRVIAERMSREKGEGREGGTSKEGD